MSLAAHGQAKHQQVNTLTNASLQEQKQAATWLLVG